MGPLMEAFTATARGVKGHPKQCTAPMAACPFRPAGVCVPELDRSAQEGGGAVWWGIFSAQGPHRDLLHKTIDISIKIEAQEVKAANAPCASALPCVIPSENVNEIKRAEGHMMSRMILRSSPEIDYLSSPIWMMPLGTTQFYPLTHILQQNLPELNINKPFLIKSTFVSLYEKKAGSPCTSAHATLLVKPPGNNANLLKQKKSKPF